MAYYSKKDAGDYETVNRTAKQMQELEFEEDSVTAVMEPLDPGLQPLKPHQCPNCDRRPKADSLQSVGVQTSCPDAGQAKGSRLSVKSDDMSVSVPKEKLAAMYRYYMAVKEAYYNYALTDGDSKEVVRKLFEQTPEILSAPDQRGHNPIEAALVQGKWTAGAQLLELAGRKNPRALRHRTGLAEDALMLAIAGGNEATVRQLLALRCGLDVCVHYDAKGRNSLHVCALGTGAQILDIILAELDSLLLKGELLSDCATSAFCTSDRDGCTPLHYMARGNQVGMLNAVYNFARRHRLQLDWDARQISANGRHALTPLAVAAEVDALDACRFLLQNGLAGIDPLDQADMWLEVTLNEPARSLLGQHCRLLQPISALPPGTLQDLQKGLQERRLTEEFLLRLRAHWPNLPQLPSVATVLNASQTFSDNCRLVAWSILNALGVNDLARLLEA